MPEEHSSVAYYVRLYGTMSMPHSIRVIARLQAVGATLRGTERKVWSGIILSELGDNW